MLKRELDIPVLGEYDVVVCGGGVAGFVAAEGIRTADVDIQKLRGRLADQGVIL